MGTRVIGGKTYIVPDRPIISVNQRHDGSSPLRGVVFGETDDLSGGDGYGEQHEADRVVNIGDGGEIEFAGVTNPIDLTGEAPYGYTKTGRIRNRPVGSGTRGGGSSSAGTGRGKRQEKTATNFIADSLVVLNEFVGHLLKTDAFDMDEDVSKDIAAALQEVGDLYDVPIIDHKTAAWGKLGIVLAKHYIPSVVLYRKETQTKKRPQVVPPLHVPHTMAN